MDWQGLRILTDVLHKWAQNNDCWSHYICYTDSFPAQHVVLGVHNKWHGLCSFISKSLFRLASLFVHMLQWWPIWDFTAAKFKCFLLCINSHWKYENKQYTIEIWKSLKNCHQKRKKFKFFKICCFFRPFFWKSRVFEKWAWQSSNVGQTNPIYLHF